MRRLLLTIWLLALVCIISLSTLAYLHWRKGKVVLERWFDGIHIQVRKYPRSLASSETIDQSYAIEVSRGQEQFITSYTMDAFSNHEHPIDIVRLGGPTEQSYEIIFDPAYLNVGIRLRHEKNLAEWFLTTAPQK